MMQKRQYFTSLSWGALYRISVLFSGLAFLAVLPYYLDEMALGIYYSLLGLLNLYIIGDLGLSSALVNYISHNILNDEFDNSANSVRCSNLLVIFKFAFIWLLLSFIFIFFLVSFLSHFVLIKVSFEHTILFSTSLGLASAFSLSYFIALSILEGSGHIVKVFKAKLLFTILTTVLQVLLIILGYGVYSLTAAYVISLIAIIPFLVNSISEVIAPVKKYKKSTPTISIRKDVFPFQLRVSISWIFGYVPWQTIPTVILVFLSAEWAGKFGLANQIVIAVSGTAFVAVQSIVPKLGHLISKGDKQKAWRIFIVASIISLALSILGYVFVILCLKFGEAWGYIKLDRFLPINMLMIYMILIFVNWYVFSIAAFGRVNHKEYFLWPTVIGGPLSLILISILAPVYGGDGVLLAVLGAAIMVNFFWGSVIIHKQLSIYFNE